MGRLSRRGFLVLAVAFHLIYIYSVFDIYFVSPIVSGMRSHGVDSAEPPAQRLVLFVGDGLRADKAFQSFPDPSPQLTNSEKDEEEGKERDDEPRPMMPFLRSKVLSEGTFGVSHTRVPTESRPGHVALIAGLYEDVSAVMTGWQLNPVNFDSVFNRSRHTWSWGSPDILPMFKEGAVPGRIDADTYGAEAEDFTQDAVQLDIWVFEKVKELFAEAQNNVTLAAELRQPGNVFFLHLLGLDTTGHAYRPYSREYLYNIKVVDEGVKEITELIDNFYGDGKTAYVFSADHGMSDWGSHGDGHPDNTRTPLVAWGSGIAHPVINVDGQASGHQDGFSSDWNLDNVQRNDVSQADVATLMAYLAGLDFPVNSVGELPLNYLDADDMSKAKAFLANARQILEMYYIKEQRKESTKLRFKPFQGFGERNSSASARVSHIEHLIDTDNSASALKECHDLIQLSLQGLRYLQTYDWLFLRSLCTVGYLGWIAFSLVSVIDLHVLQGRTEPSRNLLSNTFFSSVLLMNFSKIYIERSSLTYYAYAVFPVLFWEQVYARRYAIAEGRKVLFKDVSSNFSLAVIGTQALAFIGLLEVLVVSYERREVYTACYILAILWPASFGVDFLQKNTLLVATWAGSCSLMSVFTLLSAMKVEDITLITLSGLLMLGVGIVYLLFEKSILGQSGKARDDPFPSSLDYLSRAIIGVQVGLVGLAVLVTRSSVKSLQAREGLPLGSQMIGWTVLVLSLVVPFFHSLAPNNHYLHRLMVIFLTFAPTFIILTISYEGLFYFAFSATLVTWVRLEHRIFVYSRRPDKKAVAMNGSDNLSRPSESKSNEAVEQEGRVHAKSIQPDTTTAKARHEKKDNEGIYRVLTLNDGRIALFFLFLLQSAFFSTGNQASISSFSLDAVYRLIPVFDPYSQGVLLLFKLLVPFACISASLGLLNRRLGVAPSALFMIVTALTDIITLNFFYMVRDEGSWLEIGSTLSQFCIASLLGIFVAGLEFASEVFVGGVEFEV